MDGRSPSNISNHQMLKSFRSAYPFSLNGLRRVFLIFVFGSSTIYSCSTQKQYSSLSHMKDRLCRLVETVSFHPSRKACNWTLRYSSKTVRPMASATPFLAIPFPPTTTTTSSPFTSQCVLARTNENEDQDACLERAVAEREGEREREPSSHPKGLAPKFDCFVYAVCFMSCLTNIITAWKMDLG